MVFEVATYFLPTGLLAAFLPGPQGGSGACPGDLGAALLGPAAVVFGRRRTSALGGWRIFLPDMVAFNGARYTVGRKAVATSKTIGIRRVFHHHAQKPYRNSYGFLNI